MELYIEKKFIDRFNEEYKIDSTDKGKKVLATILETYGNVNWFIDCEINSVEQLDTLKRENIFFASRTNYLAPISVSSIKSHFFEKSKCEQTLIFTIEHEEWFAEAQKKGALCFSYENFDKQIEHIISVCANIKVDLSEQFVGWSFFRELMNVPKNRITINDGYLLTENSGNKPLDQNLIPLIKNISAIKSELKIDLYTNYLNFNKTSDYFDIKKVKSKLNNVFKSDYNFSIEYIQYHEHDRILYSNFFMIECGVGFNFNISNKPNSKITVDTIFDKFDYKRMNNHLRNLNLKKRTSNVER
jgi:hypothetical protein